MTSDEAGALWRLEERFWTGGADVYATAMHPECVMAFAPIGILRGARIVETLDGAPRWTTLDIHAPQLARPAPDVAVLAYEARARREDVIYRALCTSTYLRTARGWALVQHQQTAL